MPEITVGTQDSLPAIARRHGFFWKTVWEHAENAELRAQRDPNILQAGDRLFVPELRRGSETIATEAKHTFRVIGEATKIRIALARFGKPRANEPYQVEINKELVDGTTDAEGILEVAVPAGVTSALLLLAGGEEQHELRVARLDPSSSVSGVKQRLNNLGFPCGSEDDQVTPRYTDALLRFQRRHGLTESGEADSKTLAKLDSLYC